MPAVTRQACLITPHTRSAIHRKMKAEKPWKGTRHGVRIEIEHARQLDFAKNPIYWRARIGTGGWIDGHAPTVWDAIQQIETAAAKPPNTKGKEKWTN